MSAALCKPGIVCDYPFPFERRLFFQQRGLHYENPTVCRSVLKAASAGRFLQEAVPVGRALPNRRSEGRVTV